MSLDDFEERDLLRLANTLAEATEDLPEEGFTALVSILSGEVALPNEWLP